MVPASSMHGGSHQARVAGATGACLHAWALRKSVSAQCSPTPIRCTAWQGMGCKHGARAIHKRAVRWRKHSTRHQRLLPWRSASSPSFSSNGLGAWAVHKCTTGCRLQAHRLTAGNNDYALSTSAPSNVALHCFLSPFARTGNPTSTPLFLLHYSMPHTQAFLQEQEVSAIKSCRGSAGGQGLSLCEG